MNNFNSILVQALIEHRIKDILISQGLQSDQTVMLHVHSGDQPITSVEVPESNNSEISSLDSEIGRLLENMIDNMIFPSETSMHDLKFLLEIPERDNILAFGGGVCIVHGKRQPCPCHGESLDGLENVG